MGRNVTLGKYHKRLKRCSSRCDDARLRARRPRCYQADYARDAEHVACTARSPTCFPNSGTYLATAHGMERWFEAQNATLHEFLNSPMSNAECTHDQVDG